MFVRFATIALTAVALALGTVGAEAAKPKQQSATLPGSKPAPSPKAKAAVPAAKPAKTTVAKSGPTKSKPAIATAAKGKAAARTPTRQTVKVATRTERRPTGGSARPLATAYAQKNSLYKTAAATAMAAPKGERRVVALTQEDDSLIDVLARENVAADDMLAAVDALDDLEVRARLRVGDRLELVIDGEEANGERSLAALRIIRSSGDDVTLVRGLDGRFAATGEAGAATTQLTLTGRVANSWSASLAGAGVPLTVMDEIDRLISLDLDLARPVPPGSTFEVLAERRDAASGSSHTVRFVGINVAGHDHRIYRYMPSDGPAGYFDENGRSIAPLSLAIPVADARLTSDFGWRRHPRLKRRMFHSGIDLAAPNGTPIIASADGTIEWAGWRGAYGRYIRIAHGNGVSTGYGHLRDYASGITEGVRVTQGQVIGYVGSSGRSTGSHVDFAVLVDGRPVNPMNALMPAPRDLRGPELVAFRNHVAQLHGTASVSP